MDHSLATFGDAAMTTGSTLPRRLLARELRRAREAASVSAEAARSAIGVSKQTFWRMENGIPIRLNPLFIKRLCEIYQASTEMTQVLLTLTDETKSKGWWHAFDSTIPKSFGLFVSLEDAAQHVVSYQTTFLPGMLQTDEYRRAMHWIEHPNTPMSDVETSIEIATRRRARLTRTTNPLTLEVIIDETVLRRPAGCTDVMVDQLNHLAEAAQLPNVSVRIVPLSKGAYQGLLVGMFVMLEFPPHSTAYLTEPPVVYVQGFTGDMYLERPEEISAYRIVCTDLKRLALDETASRALILDIAEEFSA
ncbi:DUF5753 domain-containing protein [Nocardia sp. NPDC006044]|uniref:DUF5753 domain-containing protein n=1 Tax=Nocardia sp. NPDC006044 TaxID=3364306 RepID=UPI0036B007E5